MPRYMAQHLEHASSQLLELHGAHEALKVALEDVSEELHESEAREQLLRVELRTWLNGGAVDAEMEASIRSAAVLERTVRSLENALASSSTEALVPVSSTIESGLVDDLGRQVSNLEA